MCVGGGGDRRDIQDLGKKIVVPDCPDMQLYVLKLL